MVLERSGGIFQSGLLAMAAVVAVIVPVIVSVGCDRAERPSEPSHTTRVDESEAGTTGAETARLHEQRANRLGAASTTRPADPRLKQAFGLIRNKRLEEARQAVGAVLAEHPADPDAWFYKGLIEHEAHRYDAAAEHLKRALGAASSGGARFESDLNARYFLGWCLYHTAAFEEADRAFGAYLAEKPNVSSAHFGRGQVAFELGNRQKAEASYRRAIELEQVAAKRKGKLADYTTRLGDLLILENRLQEARDALEQVTRLRPDQYSSYYKLYQLYSRLGDPDNAARCLEQYEARWKKVVEG